MGVGFFVPVQLIVVSCFLLCFGEGNGWLASMVNSLSLGLVFASGDAGE
jgi:hypothetical protein